MKLQGEEEFAERVGLVGPTHTLHTDGNHPPGRDHRFARNLCLTLCIYRVTALRIVKAMEGLNLQKFL